MAEAYIGTKFRTIFIKGTIPKDARTAELAEWGGKFCEMGIAPPCKAGTLGNLSFRTADGFIITATNSHLGELKESDFVKVLDCDFDACTVSAMGAKEPSSEAMLHYAIYEERENINAILHGHDEIALKHAEELDIPVTAEEKPYGTEALVDAVLGVMGSKNYFAAKNHGIFSVGKTIGSAGKLAVSMHGKAVSLGSKAKE